MSKEGFFIGKKIEESPSGGSLTYTGNSHLWTIGLSGSGKSRCVGIPNLILHKGGCVATDIKGSLARMTALWRMQMHGQPARVIDPFKIVEDKYLPKELVEGKNGEPSSLQPVRGSINPIDFIINARSPHAAAYRVAEALIPQEDPRNTHWVNGAQNLLVAFLMFVAFDPIIDQIMSLEEIEVEGEQEAEEDGDEEEENG